MKKLKDEADGLSVQAVKNVFSDLSALIAFTVVCFVSRDDLRLLRGFFDEAVYGLSDSAKAFAIILFILLNFIIGYGELTIQEMQSADQNLDGVINVVDIIGFLNIILGE